MLLISCSSMILKPSFSKEPNHAQKISQTIWSSMEDSKKTNVNGWGW